MTCAQSLQPDALIMLRYSHTKREPWHKLQNLFLFVCLNETRKTLHKTTKQMDALEFLTLKILVYTAIRAKMGSPVYQSTTQG